MTREDLIKCNAVFDHVHGLGEFEVEEANRHIVNIGLSQCRNRHPSVGDLVEGVYYSTHEYRFGLVESVSRSGVIGVCYDPYVPFIYSSRTDVRLSVSGGPFTHAHMSCFELVADEEPRMFCAWGECGGCADGAFNFPAKVKRWRLVEAPKVGRDVWDTNTITYEVTGSKHFKGIRIGFGAEPGDKAEVQSMDGSWFETEYLGYTAATIQKLEHEIGKEVTHGIR